MLRQSFRCLMLCVVSTPLAYGQYETERGAAVGGVAGAVIGGIIGHQNDETPEGALIGGAVGAVTGGIVGHVQKQKRAEQLYWEQQQRERYYQAQQDRAAVAATNAISFGDVVALSRNGVSDAVIVEQIRINGVRQRLSVNDILALNEQGVSGVVIQAMQDAPVVGGPVTYAPRPTTVRPNYPTATRYRPPTSNYAPRTIRRRF